MIYHADEPGQLTIDADVEVFTGFTERGEVRYVTTPVGEAAVTAHYGRSVANLTILSTYSVLRDRACG